MVTRDDTLFAAVALLNTLETTPEIADAINLLLQSADTSSWPTGVKVIWRRTDEMTTEEKKRLIRNVIDIRKPKKTTKSRANKILANKAMRVGFVNPDIYRGYGPYGVIIALSAQSYKKLIID